MYKKTISFIYGLHFGYLGRGLQKLDWVHLSFQLYQSTCQIWKQCNKDLFCYGWNEEVPVTDAAV